jgi:hypothetical protein
VGYDIGSASNAIYAQIFKTLPAIMKIRQIVLFLLIINSLSACYGQTKIIYHEYEPTASDFAIVKWNISKDRLPKNYLRETIDDHGRVIELQFFENNSNLFDRLCYLSPWVKYEYPNDTTIIEYHLDGNGQPESNLECETPSKVTYYLNKNKTIILKTKPEYLVDTALYLSNGWTLNSINEELMAIKKNQKTYPVIGYFSKSKSKLNGKFPVSTAFNIKVFYFNITEKTEIEKVLNKK